MALDKTSLKNRIKAEMIALGAQTGNHSWLDKYAQAFANAIVDEVQANGEAVVAGGSSAGSHPIE